MTTPFKVLLFDAKPFDKGYFEAFNLRAEVIIDFENKRLGPDTCMLAKGYQAVCIFVNDIASKEVIDTLASYGVKLISLRCTGYNNVDLEAAKGKLAVTYVPDYSPFAVAEHAAALILSLNRKIPQACQRTRSYNFEISPLLGFDMHGKTAGVIGCGKIGKALVDILRGFGMQVLMHDIFIDREFAESRQAAYVDLDTLFKESDIVSLHTPLNAQTRHLINASALEKMKEGAMLINTGRGALIDTTALLSALKSKKISAAGLDVYENESPYFFADHSKIGIQDPILIELLSLPNVILTGHQGFFTKEAIEKLTSATLQSIHEFISGKPLTYSLTR